jgi:hypothetical protein
MSQKKEFAELRESQLPISAANANTNHTNKRIFDLASTERRGGLGLLVVKRTQPSFQSYSR